jgi:hypothetical protein
MSENDENDTDHTSPSSSKAAEVVRRLSHSIRSFRNMIQLPGVGSLPRHAVLKRRQQLPVKRVANVSDRLSTGIHPFQTAVEAEESCHILCQIRGKGYIARCSSL